MTQCGYCKHWIRTYLTEGGYMGNCGPSSFERGSWQEQFWPDCFCKKIR
jgi:hypothetical protein